MIRISIKTYNSATRKIQLNPVGDSATAFRIEIDRRRLNRPDQRESIFTQEDVLQLVAETLGWDVERMEFEPEPPKRIQSGTRVVIISHDEDLMPRRRKTFTSSEPFLDWRGVWRVFCVGERKAVKLELVRVDQGA